MPRVKALEENIYSLGDSLNTDELAGQIQSLEDKTSTEGFWNDIDSSKKILAELKRKKGILNDFLKLKKDFEDLKELIDLASESQDEALADEIIPELNELEKGYQSQRISLMLSGEYDKNNAILTIHPGAGGTEAQDWAEMLYRMYCRFAERDRFKVKVLDYLEGEEAGIKSVSILVSGENAYGYLKGEAGVHRLVRVSPFDASGRRHTSFAAVDVIPEMNDDIKIDINENDLKVETHRSSGAGGQHINKTDSAVRIIHIPTGIVVGCQTERSQMQNRETAMRMLKSKLLEIKEREHFEKIEDIKGVKMNIEWGSQIRSYVFMPYTLVKDNRTGYETGNIDAVMDGDLNGFIDAYLKTQVKK
ncbi:MAG: peptide chain release factor 2 [Clostridiales bacterium]|nr:peptide chain release factor 2 [Clostridiales bacterium]